MKGAILYVVTLVDCLHQGVLYNVNAIFVYFERIVEETHVEKQVIYPFTVPEATNTFLHPSQTGDGP